MVVSLSVHSAALSDFFNKADTFLKKYVKNGSVNYKLVTSNKGEISSLVSEIGTINLSRIDEKNRKAFYINAYNLLVIQSIVDKYPVESPMKIEGFFDKKKHWVAGEQLTLNELEKEKLLKPYGDPRFHFALVCAAKSCPSLANEVYLPATIDEQLDQQTRKSINNTQWLRLSPTKKKVSVSKIFEWYSGDFLVEGQSIITWINKYRDTKIPTGYQLEYYEYDWSLNE